MPRKTRSLEDRLWERVDKTGPCWEWTGPLHESGYGLIGAGGRGGRILRTHRVAYELLVGPIPDGLHIDHLCRNRKCCNPAHLEPVTQAENNQRMWDANARTHCSSGHPLEPRRPGQRKPACRICKSEYDRRRYIERKAS